MNAYRRTIVIDVDGTLYDNFKRDDKKIISKIFGGNKPVLLLDKFLWFINSLDIISNSMSRLDLRLRIYSILSLKNFDYVTEQYKQRYQNLLKADMQSKETLLEEISRMYEVIIVTNNSYAIDVLYHIVRCELIYAPSVGSRVDQIREKSYYKTISYIVGNNYKDDISITKQSNIKSIYLGKSIFKKFFKADFNITSLDEVLEIIKDGS